MAARDVIEYLDSIDFNKYYDNMQKPSSRSGEAQRVFLEFSLNSIRAAQVIFQALELVQRRQSKLCAACPPIHMRFILHLVSTDTSIESVPASHRRCQYHSPRKFRTVAYSSLITYMQEVSKTEMQDLCKAV